MTDDSEDRDAGRPRYRRSSVQFTEATTGGLWASSGDSVDRSSAVGTEGHSHNNGSHPEIDIQSINISMSNLFGGSPVDEMVAGADVLEQDVQECGEA